MPRTIPHTALLTALHLMVDGLCACSLFMLLGPLSFVGMAVLFVTYNVLAFMTQPLVGLWMDRRRPSAKCLWTAILLLLSGALLTTFFPLYSTARTNLFLAVIATLLGLGNSLFHVYGGKYVAENTANDPRHLGIFVSTGALGLALGSAFHSLLLMVLLAAMMVVAVALFEHSTQPSATVSCDASQDRPSPTAHHAASQDSPVAVVSPTTPQDAPTAPALLLFMLLLVFGRSFVGSIEPASVGQMAHYAAIASLLAFCGKASGGFLARRFGAWPTLTVTLLASAACLLLCGEHWFFAIAMVLCINLTMPLTLHLANRSMPRRAGFAFGSLACILIPGLALGIWCTAGSAIPLLVYPLVATIAIEALVLFALGERRWTVLAASFAMNIATNLPLNLLAGAIPMLQTSFLLQLPLEAAIVIVEALLFRLVVRSSRRAFIYSIVCNAASYLSGLIFGILLG